MNSSDEGISSFNALDLDAKGNLVFTRGEYVSVRTIYNALKIQLYNANGLYVEVHYNPTTNKIVNIQAVTQDHVLEYYIDLRDLYYNDRGLIPPKK